MRIIIKSCKASKIWGLFLAVLIWAAIFHVLALKANSKEQFKQKLDLIIKNIASRYNVPADLIHSIIDVESNYNHKAVSPKGAVGLMQLMPETAKKYGVHDLYNPRQNIEGGVKYLKDLMKLYNQRTDFVLAAYNAGQEAIKKYGGIPPYPETKNYIEKIKASYPKSIITTRTKIYKFYDESGRLILTNTPYLYTFSKKRID